MGADCRRETAGAFLSRAGEQRGEGRHSLGEAEAGPAGGSCLVTGPRDGSFSLVTRPWAASSLPPCGLCPPMRPHCSPHPCISPFTLLGENSTGWVTRTTEVYSLPVLGERRASPRCGRAVSPGTVWQARLPALGSSGLWKQRPGPCLRPHVVLCVHVCFQISLLQGRQSYWIRAQPPPV